jgi:hypothetical protein
LEAAGDEVVAGWWDEHGEYDAPDTKPPVQSGAVGYRGRGERPEQIPGLGLTRIGE